MQGYFLIKAPTFFANNRVHVCSHQLLAAVCTLIRLVPLSFHEVQMYTCHITMH